jgi:hypothetical protein
MGTVGASVVVQGLCECAALADRAGGRGIGFADCSRCTPGVCLLCRNTALHLASQEGHTETAMALVAAGADVHRTFNDGYGRRFRCVAGAV